MIKLTLEIQGNTLSEVLAQLTNANTETVLVAATENNGSSKSVNIEGAEATEVTRKRRKKEKAEPEARVIEEVTEDESVKETPQVEVPDERNQTSITMDSLLDLAKAKVSEISRDAVKEVISKYGARISEVDPTDYEALKADLEALSNESL